LNKQGVFKPQQKEATLATPLSPQAAGKKILEYYKRGKIRPNEMLVLQNLLFKFEQDKGSQDEFDRAVEWLKQQGYLEIRAGKNTAALYLTESGFAVSRL
jgi:hypothetical protein